MKSNSVERVKPELQLTGLNGNAFVIMGNAASVLKRAGFSTAEVEQYKKEAKSGNYDHLLQVTMSWCDCV